METYFSKRCFISLQGHAESYALIMFQTADTVEGWEMIPCSPIKVQRFGGTYCLHL
jgi:hypothetical protein